VSAVADDGRPVPVSASVVRPLRAAILRPGQTPEQLVYRGDEDPGSRHLAVHLEGQLIGIASVMADGYPPDPRAGDWRIRGMAVEQAHRGRGIGSALLEACEAHARSRGATRLWCNARVDARNLYGYAGMGVEGEEFEIPGIGRHLLMSKPLA
jgi:GNAT superfamily N-acetyltransferase